MPSNYAGNDAAVQSPGTAPAVNNPPVLSLPSDGDADNAAAYAQAYKILADNMDFALDVLGGTLTAKALQVDGTGGAASAQPAGTLGIAGAIGGALTIPSPTKVPNTLYKDVMVFAAASFAWSGSAIVTTYGFNVNTITRSLAGTFNVTFKTAALQSNPPIALVTICQPGATAVLNGPPNGTSSSGLTLITQNSSGTATDFANAVIHVVVYGY